MLLPNWLPEIVTVGRITAEIVKIAIRISVTVVIGLGNAARDNAGLCRAVPLHQQVIHRQGFSAHAGGQHSEHITLTADIKAV